MGSKKRSKKSSAPKAVENESQVVDIEAVNLRTTGPVTRLRGVVAGMIAKATYAQERLTSWGEANPMVNLLKGDFGILNKDLESLAERLEQLELSGFSPPRKSFTADTAEGDRVTIIEQYRDRYEDLIDSSLMSDLVVTKKRPGRGGGLILEATDGTKVQAALAHVVRISKPVTL